MKRKIPVFQYDDAWQILARGDRLNGLVIDAGSEEVMLRIEASMSKLKVMGDDDRRFFWIWAQVNKREREWLLVLTAHYNDFHYLILSDNRSKMAVLQNAESTTSNKEKYREDMKEYLLTLEAHVNAVVDWICEAPEEYHAYVERYDSKGQEIEGMDLDTQEAYDRWRKENRAFHCMDVSYARIHLSPWRENDSESYHFHLNFGVYGFYDEVAEIAIALYNQGLTLEVDEIDSILKILRQEDMVGFRPHPDKYMNRDGVTNQYWLPNIGEVTKEVYWKIIKSTKWHKQYEPWPL